MWAAPSALRPLSRRLQTRDASKCQRLLTVGIEAWGGVLERLERGIRLEALREVLGGLRVESVASETANESQIEVSEAGDSRKNEQMQWFDGQCGLTQFS